METMSPGNQEKNNEKEVLLLEEKLRRLSDLLQQQTQEHTSLVEKHNDSLKELEALQEQLNRFEESEEEKVKEVSSETSTNPEDDIPDKYRGLDADTLEEMWTTTEYTDPAKTKQEKQKKARVIAYLRAKEKENKKSTSLKFGDDQEVLGGIEKTMEDIASAAKQGFGEDVRRKIEQYVAEIESGKNKAYVLDGVPDEWKDEVERILQEETDAKKQENKKSFDSLSPEDIQKFLKMLPQEPVEGNPRVTNIDRNVLKTGTYDSLEAGDGIYIHLPGTRENGFKEIPFLGNIISKGHAGNVMIKLSDGREFPVLIGFSTNYKLSDIKKLYEEGVKENTTTSEIHEKEEQKKENGAPENKPKNDESKQEDKQQETPKNKESRDKIEELLREKERIQNIIEKGNKLRAELPESQINTRTEATQRFLDFMAEVYDVPKYDEGLESGKYTTWIQQFGKEGELAAWRLNALRSAIDMILNAWSDKLGTVERLLKEKK